MTNKNLMNKNRSENFYFVKGLFSKRFNLKDFEEDLNRDGMREYLYGLICDKLIMKNKEKPDYTIGENVEYENEIEE